MPMSAVAISANAILAGRERNRSASARAERRGIVLAHNKLANLPRGTSVVGLALQSAVGVVWVDDEERSLVADGHVVAVALQCEKNVELLEVGDGNFGRVVVQRCRG